MKNNRALVQNMVQGGGNLLLNKLTSGFSCALKR